MRCRICNYCETVEGEPDLTDSTHKRRVYKKAFWKDNEDLCSTCIKAIRDTKDDYTFLASQGEDQGYSWSSSIEDMVTELEQRMPELFEGQACPGTCRCNCTYKSGCKALQNKG